MLTWTRGESNRRPARRRVAVAVLLSLLAVGAAVGLGPPAPAGGASPFVLFSGQSAQTATTDLVPEGICFVSITAEGGHGGSGFTVDVEESTFDPLDNGGAGALVSARVLVVPGTTFDVLVGGAGHLVSVVAFAWSDGGLGGGGGGGGMIGVTGGVGLGGGGGGASVVATSGGEVLVVAGGGGGGGFDGQGGAGGQLGQPGGFGLFGGIDSAAGGTADGDGGSRPGGAGGGGVTDGGLAAWPGGGGNGAIGGGGGGAGNATFGAGSPGGEGGATGTGAPGQGPGGDGGAGSHNGGDGGDGADWIDEDSASAMGGGGGGGLGFGGGAGGHGYLLFPLVGGIGGGGGGGGWGGGASDDTGGGGGGSSFATPAGVVTSDTSDRPGDGQVTITYDPDTDACGTSTDPPTDPSNPGGPSTDVVGRMNGFPSFTG